MKRSSRDAFSAAEDMEIWKLALEFEPFQEESVGERAHRAAEMISGCFEAKNETKAVYFRFRFQLLPSVKDSNLLSWDEKLAILEKFGESAEPVEQNTVIGDQEKRKPARKRAQKTSKLEKASEAVDVQRFRRPRITEDSGELRNPEMMMAVKQEDVPTRKSVITDVISGFVKESHDELMKKITEAVSNSEFQSQFENRSISETNPPQNLLEYLKSLQKFTNSLHLPQLENIRNRIEVAIHIQKNEQNRNQEQNQNIPVEAIHEMLDCGLRMLGF